MAEPSTLGFGATGALGALVPEGLLAAAITPATVTAARRFWVNTVSLDHVEGAIEGGFTQADHGSNTRLHRPRPGDLMVFYSPRTTLPGGTPVRRFTALATITGDRPYQVTISEDFQPWRLAVQFHRCARVDPKPLVDQLSFIKDPRHWGLPFRRGLFTIPQDDFSLIAHRMSPAGPADIGSASGANP